MQMAAQETRELMIHREIKIAAPVEIAFEAILEELGPGGEMPGGKPFPMVVEPWPGGRWYRDLGDDSGHLWGHVQVIKPPALLELCGPMFMSYPALNHVQYRLKAVDDGGARLTFTHRAFGTISPEHRDGVGQGWEHGLKRICEIAERLDRAARRARALRAIEEFTAVGRRAAQRRAAPESRLGKEVRMSGVRVLVGTRKGAFVLTSDGSARSLGGSRAPLRGLGDLSRQGLARRPEPAVRVAVERVVRADDPAIRRRRRDVGAGRQRVPL